MRRFFLGADLGATKTHILISDESGCCLAFVEGGPGNHEVIGFEALQINLSDVVNQAFKKANLSPANITAAGFGVAGYDWPSEREPILQVIRSLRLGGVVELVNDCDLGLIAGSPNGWGVTVVSGTGCNCRGWDQTLTRYGRVTGGGYEFGELAGAVELLHMTVRALSYAWTGRGPQTALAQKFLEVYGLSDLGELLQDLLTGKITLNPEDARLVFQVAEKGDAVAIDLIRTASRELGELALCVIRQLAFEGIDFDLTLIGSMFDGSPLLEEEMKKTVLAVAPGARFLRIKHPPVIGAVLLAMRAANIPLDGDFRKNIIEILTKQVKNEQLV